MYTEVITQWENASQRFMSALSQYNQQQINHIPFEGSWTAAQVGHHILQSISGIPDLFNQPGTQANRPVDEKRQLLADVFLDFDTKLQSPGFILPDNTPWDNEDLINQLSKAALAITYTTRHTDLQMLCKSLDLPVFEKLTYLEIVHFITYHTQRHTHQLQNIYKALTT